MKHENDVNKILEHMSDSLQTWITQHQLDNPAMVGIHTGGVWIAQRLHEALSISESMGYLDISFYRDDFTRIGMNPQVKPSNIPFAVDNRHIILVDDVLHTGRTVRAALNELFDFGRPASIALAALVERSGRELPIEANIVGIHMDLQPTEHVKLNGPDPLTLVVQQSESERTDA